MFPWEWAVAMAESWLNNSEYGFLTPVGLSCKAIGNWSGTPELDDYHFGVTPDANWYMLRGLYLHAVDTLANKFTLTHLKGYHLERGIPFASEARNMDFNLFGDQYSNFNAGKILLILEGIGGLRYSMPDDSFTFSDNLPLEWSFMEFRVPVYKAGNDVAWVSTRAERRCDGATVTKAVHVSLNPFGNLYIRPWAEDAEVLSSLPSDSSTASPVGHLGWLFNTAEANVTLTLSHSTNLDGVACYFG